MAPRRHLAQRRRALGWSQESLAEQLGVERSTIARWEAGRTEPQPWLRPLLASALRLSDAEIDQLLSEQQEHMTDGVGTRTLPFRARGNASSPHDEQPSPLVASIYQQLTDYPQFATEGGRLWPLPQLRNATVEVHRAYQAARYEAAAERLPDLLAAADAFDGYAGAESREIHLSRCAVYAATAKLLRKVGEGHLAWIAADRATHAAMASDSAPAQGLAAYEVSAAMLSIGRLEQAERIAVGAAGRLTAMARPDMPDVTSLAGALWLISGVIAARRSDGAEANDRLGNAQRLAGVLRHDGNFGWTAFGPTNVLIHRATVASELGDPSGVIEAAASIDAEVLPVGLNGRRARIYLDLGWAQTQARHDAEAILYLQHAERLAPESLRYNRIAREQLRELLHRARRPSPALTRMANTAGVLE